MAMPTTHHHSFTSRTTFAMQKTANKGTILNGPIRKSIKSSTDHSNYAQCGITQLVIHNWKCFRKIYCHEPYSSHEPYSFPIKALPNNINDLRRLPIFL